MDKDRETYGDDRKRRCTARTRTGARCRKLAVTGSDRCAHHAFAVPGRPSKVSPELTQQVVDALLDGNYMETAAAVVGISKSTLYRWLRKAEELEVNALELAAEAEDLEPDLYSYVDPADWPLLDFRHSVKSAEAWAEAELLRKARAAGLGWQAFMTILERRHPQRWGRRKSFDHDDDELRGRGRAVELITPDEDEARHAIARMLDAAGALEVADTENTPDQQEA